MVHLLNAVTLAEHLVADLVEVLNTRREPGHLRRADLRDAIGELVKLGYSGDDGALRQRALNIDKEVYLALLARNKFGWLRLDPGHVHVVLGEDAKRLVKDSWLLAQGEGKAGAIVVLQVSAL